MTAPDPHVHPAWYGAVMGTGALALALAAQSDAWGWDWLDAIAVAMLIVASIMAIVLLPRYLRRLSDRGSLAREIANPAQGPMLATLPAGLLVLASGWGRIGPSFVPTTAALWVDAVLLVIGALLGLALSVIWSASLLQSTPGLEGVNGGWLVPPVMTLLVPLGLAPLIVANPDAAPLLLLIGFAFFGIGTVLFLSMLTLLVARLALRDPLPPAMAPSMWIPLAPAGMIGLALIRLLQAGTQAGVRDFHGVGTKFDKGGNYNLGILEQSIFPELTFEETQVIHGMQVTFVIKNEDKAHSRALLEKFGIPFEKPGGAR